MRLGYQQQKWDADTREWVKVSPEVTMWPASAEGVGRVIAANPDLLDGETRSEWLWIRFANGDLVLGLFPQDDLYDSLEKTINNDYMSALSS